MKRLFKNRPLLVIAASQSVSGIAHVMRNELASPDAGKDEMRQERHEFPHKNLFPHHLKNRAI
jgi:hypothetical protein